MPLLLAAIDKLKEGAMNCIFRRVAQRSQALPRAEQVCFGSRVLCSACRIAAYQIAVEFYSMLFWLPLEGKKGGWGRNWSRRQGLRHASGSPIVWSLS